MGQGLTANPDGSGKLRHFNDWDFNSATKKGAAANGCAPLRSEDRRESIRVGFGDGFVLHFGFGCVASGFGAGNDCIGTFFDSSTGIGGGVFDGSAHLVDIGFGVGSSAVHGGASSVFGAFRASRQGQGGASDGGGENDLAHVQFLVQC